jgi:hypothetical protein
VNPKNAFRCFDGRYVIESLIVAVVFIGLAFIGKRFPDGTAPRIAIAVAEIVLFGYLVLGTLLRIRRLDELHQRIHLIAIAASFGLASLIVIAAEFLSSAGVPVPPVGVWLWFVMTFAWGIGVLIVSRRYR